MTTRTLAWLMLGTTLATMAACYSAASTNGAANNNDGSANDGSGNGTKTDQNPTTPTGLPCDVQTFLEKNCQSCHGAKPTKGVPMSLVTYEDLTKPDDDQTIADLCVERMKSADSPMPPSGLLADISVFETWVKAGKPKGTCEPASSSTGNTGGDAGQQGQSDPFNTPSVCTSNTHWTGGDEEDPTMHPGMACITCHKTKRKAPTFLVAGTVFPTGHEPDDCNGKSAVSVVITGADGKQTTLTANEAGNFFVKSGSATIATPYTAKVVANGKERAMTEKQTSGDCNSCHTENGANSAPGRIMAP